MQQPTPLWQVISICVMIILTCGAGIIAQNNKISKLEETVINIKSSQFNQEMETAKKFDKLEAKIDFIQTDTRQILINLERKADRE